VTRSRDDHDPERARRYWAEHAPRYDRLISFFERVLFGGGREWACAQARGEVLEVAAGTGRNLPHYPDAVRLTVTDFSPEMLDLARARGRELGREAEFREADAGALDFPDASFDTVVCTLGLCSVPDDRRAVAEMARVLRPGGGLVLLEHVRSPSRPVSAVQRVLDVPSTRFCCDHLRREPLGHVREQRLEVERLERSKAGIVERLAARKPG
jgi:ubiquinone/menaquinone biosynthesis C-methylase UbiE